MTAPAPCLFCAIVRGDLRASVVGQGPGWAAFLDKSPLFHGHVLVVPESHRETLIELPSDEITTLFCAAKRVASAVTSAMGAQGTFVAMNNRVSQSVPHLHVHVVPRTKGDGLRGFFWPRRKYPSDSEMERIRAAIEAALLKEA